MRISAQEKAFDFIAITSLHRKTSCQVNEYGVLAHYNHHKWTGQDRIWEKVAAKT